MIARKSARIVQSRGAVQTDDAREPGFENALRHALATPAAVPPGECVDGETLAAWSEGSLPPVQAESVELHLSSCPSCQALLAAFVHTTPAQPAAVPLWRRWQLQWLVPLATATGALVIWLSVPGRPPATSAQQAVAQDARAVPELTVPASPRSPSESQKELEAKLSSQATEGSSATLRSTAPANTPPSPSIVATAAPLKPQQTAAAAADALATSVQDKQKREADARIAVVADAAPPATAVAPARTDAAAGARAAVEERKAAAAPAAPPPIAERPAAAAPAPSPTPPVAAEPPPLQAAAAPSAAGRQEAAAGGLQARAFRASSIDVASPTSASRWRIAIGAGIDYFGKTAPSGRVVDIPPSTMILAGSSPQDEVCWMVGRAGSVYLTTDGSHFTRIAFPDAVDLVAVRATDAKTVTVTSASGRMYRTTDAGKSWQ